MKTWHDICSIIIWYHNCKHGDLNMCVFKLIIVYCLYVLKWWGIILIFVVTISYVEYVLKCKNEYDYDLAKWVCECNSLSVGGIASIRRHNDKSVSMAIMYIILWFNLTVL